ncbi:MAG: HNH endonuclease [Paracoccaceae bacterium]|nr:HNH endonuclease [Paracoccaceae bacterium]
MWRWDQGRLPYFQYDALRAVAKIAVSEDLKAVDKAVAIKATGLPFLPVDYPNLWRNYSRIYKTTLLVYEDGGVALPTAVAGLLAGDGLVTSDEYFHFLAQVFSDPCPAFQEWSADAPLRFPIAFSIRYALAKLIVSEESTTHLSEILGAYHHSGFTGGESDEDLSQLISSGVDFSKVHIPGDARQARESLRVISQISYLFYRNNSITISLDVEDAKDVFEKLTPITGLAEKNSDNEIFRVSELFKGGTTLDIFDFKNTVVADVIDSGFKEGSKVKKTHVTIERNGNLRKAYFEAHPTSVCDCCKMDTNILYPWADRVLDLHHILPLSSGTRVETGGTTLTDLIPVCPTCHRAVHRYYDQWLKAKSQEDFASASEALIVYDEAKTNLGGASGA